MHVPERALELEQLLDTARAAAVQLLLILEAERDALTRRDHESLRALARRKQDRSAGLDGMAGRMAGALAGLGIDDGATVDHALEDMGLGRLAEQWRGFTTEVGRCRDLNLTNGRVIAVSQRSARRLLDILRGTDSSARLYDTRGRSHGEARSDYLTKA